MCAAQGSAATTRLLISLTHVLMLCVLCGGAAPRKQGARKDKGATVDGGGDEIVGSGFVARRDALQRQCPGISPGGYRDGADFSGESLPVRGPRDQFVSAGEQKKGGVLDYSKWDRILAAEDDEVCGEEEGQGAGAGVTLGGAQVSWEMKVKLAQACEDRGNACIHACMHACIHTSYIRAYIPTYLPTYLPTYIHTCMHAYIHTYIPGGGGLGVCVTAALWEPQRYGHKRMCFSYTYMNPSIHTYIHTHTHVYTLDCNVSQRADCRLRRLRNRLRVCAQGNMTQLKTR